MAALVVQSRFAGLKIEDDDYPSNDSHKSNKKSKINTTKKPEPQKKQQAKTNNSKPQSANKKKRNKQNSTAEQWELWKVKDEELVDGNFESELQQALVLSKLDYEEKKDVYKQMKKESEIEKKQIEQATRATTKKQKKKNVMSLDQFNDMMNDSPKCPPEDSKDPTDEEGKPPKKDKEFFERMKNETKSELLKAKIIERVNHHRQTVPDEIITKVQYAEALERKDRELAALRQEVASLKQELITVKGRNKKLCNILGQGEMKDKAEVLVELERLRAVQAELTAEMATLHTDLEKERSRNTDPKAKDKKKKLGNGERDK